ncbi:MAG: hypothetical protein E7456_06195 [Ruminococcaceae bacterium]|nr:hypothetical protein [Oscillospiraceae bacterium]
MEISISGQIIESAAALGLGLLSGFYYDILRAIRRRSRGILITMLLDALFWVVCGAALILFGLTLGGGEQRIFVVVLAFLGGWLYFVTLSRYALFLCESILELFRFMAICVSAPFIFILRYTKKLLFFIKNVFSYLKKWCTIRSYKSVLGSFALGEVYTNEAEKSRSDNKDRSYNTGGIRSRKTHKRSRPAAGSNGNSG